MAKSRAQSILADDPEHTGVTPEREPLSIYPGNLRLGEPVEQPPRTERPVLPPQKNRRAVRRKVSPFTIMLILIGAAVAIVLYIGNIIAVNQLLLEVTALENEHRQLMMEQEVLRARINKLASLEQIQEKAEGLGLQSLREPPVWMSIDPERLRAIQREASVTR